MKKVKLVQGENNKVLVSDDKIVLGDEVGYIYDDHEFSSVHYRKITQNDIVEILDNDGDCYLEMNTFEGDYCGYRTPYLINNKVVIRKGV